MALVLLSHTLTFRRTMPLRRSPDPATTFRFDAVAAAGRGACGSCSCCAAKAIRSIVVYGAGTLLISRRCASAERAPPRRWQASRHRSRRASPASRRQTTYASDFRLSAQAHTHRPLSPGRRHFRPVGLAGCWSVNRKTAGKAGRTEPRDCVGPRPLDLVPVPPPASRAVVDLAAYPILGVTLTWDYSPFFLLAAGLISLGVTLAGLGLARIWWCCPRAPGGQGARGPCWGGWSSWASLRHLSIRKNVA